VLDVALAGNFPSPVLSNTQLDCCLEIDLQAFSPVVTGRWQSSRANESVCAKQCTHLQGWPRKSLSGHRGSTMPYALHSDCHRQLVALLPPPLKANCVPMVAVRRTWNESIVVNCSNNSTCHQETFLPNFCRLLVSANRSHIAKVIWQAHGWTGWRCQRIGARAHSRPK